MSAESGVPTFRDVETGLWAKVDPYEISSSEGWRRHPERVWAWYLWRHYMMKARRTQRRPSRRRGLAGPRRGARRHPERRQSARAGGQPARLPPARQPVRIPLRPLRIRLPRRHFPTCRSRSRPSIRRSARCGGLIRPNVVWFGEPLPDERVGAVGRGGRRRRRRRSWSARRRSSTPPPGLPELALAERHPGHRGQSRNARRCRTARRSRCARPRHARSADAAAATARAARLG